MGSPLSHLGGEPESGGLLFSLSGKGGSMGRCPSDPNSSGFSKGWTRPLTSLKTFPLGELS